MKRDSTREEKEAEDEENQRWVTKVSDKKNALLKKLKERVEKDEEEHNIDS